MTFEATPDEVLIIEERVETKPEPTGGAGRMPWQRIAGVVVGSLGLGLAVTAVVRRLARRGRTVRGRRRGAWLSVQPRAAIFAPSLTISLPFSSIIGQPRSGSMRGAGRGQVRFGRPAVARREQRMSSRPARSRRFARQIAGR